MLMMAQGSLDSDRLSSAGLSSHGSTVGESVAGRDEPKRPEDEYTLGPLPPMWEKAYTPSGEAYFIDHNSGTSHWLDPRLARVRKRSLGECAEDELPFGWERVTDDRYGAYYVDHINRRTQYENPVLQATRLRAEKMTQDGGGGGGGGGEGGAGGELRGERFTVTLSKGPQGLGFTLIGGADLPGGDTAGYLQVRSVVPHSPAWIDGALRPGDVLVGVGRRGVRGATHAQVAQLFQSIPAGSRVTLLLCRGYPLAFDSEDPHTRVLSTLAVDAAPPAPAGAAAVAPSDAVAMQHLTHALRTRFNLESPGRAGGSHDEADHSPAPHSPGQRRMMSRSFDLEELGEGTEPNVAPRCPSADHLLAHTGSDGAEGAERGGGGEGGAGRELALALRRGAAGFGFTIADSVHGQKVKKVLDRSRCAGLREGDLLLQIGETDVRHAPHLRVVQVLKECPALHETTLRVWRRAAAPRSRSATRLHAPGGAAQLGRSKTPTAEQLRSPALHTVDPLHNRLNGEATYAVPEQRRESLAERRRRSSTPGGVAAAAAAAEAAAAAAARPWPAAGADEPQPSLERPQPNPDRARWPDAWLDNASDVRSWAESSRKWDENNARHWDGVNSPRWSGGGGESWGEVGTPTVRVDTDSYWRGNASAADSSDNGGFPEEGVLSAPTTAAMGAQPPHDSDSARLRTRSPSTNSGGRMRSHSPSNNSSNGRLLAHSPAGVGSTAPRRPPSPSCFTCHTAGGADSPAAPPHPHPPAALYPQVEGAGGADPEADVLVRLAPGAAGFGFRIVGGTEDGSRVAVGHVVPGGPADGLLRPGDLLTSVDGAALAGATHARAVAAVFQAAARGHVTLGVRHNRADIQSLGLAVAGGMSHHASPHGTHQPPMSSGGGGQHGYSIVHPAPLYPPHPALAPHPSYHHQQPYQHGGVGGWRYEVEEAGGGAGAVVPYDVTVARAEGEGFGFVVISSTNKATSTIGQLIPNSPAARCGLLRVGDTILAINHAPVHHLPHPDVVALIKQSARTVTLTVQPAH